jgi:hypothetical protein
MLRQLRKVAYVTNKCYNIRHAYSFPYVSSAKIKLISDIFCKLRLLTQ